jgi:uncharacterized repeat protein (TIGR01451 family)
MVRKRVLYFIMTLALVLCVTFPMMTPVMASQISGKKETIPDQPNMYRVGDTIHYEMTVSNPQGNIPSNNLTSIWDILPDGSTYWFVQEGVNPPLIQAPGQNATFYLDYVVDWDDAEYRAGLGYYVVINTFRVEGHDSDFDVLNVTVTKNSRIIQPDIDIEKYVWDGAGWQDADAETGPYLAFTPDAVVFKFEIDNTGDIGLTGVNLTDTDMSTFYTNQACTSPASLPTALAVNETKTYYGKLAWAPGQHSNNATATGQPPVGDPVSDSDPANYFGGNPTIDLIKYVSVNNQTSWDDANSPPGPSILVGKDVYFKFRIENTGNVTLTGITLTDSVYNLAGITPALPASLAAGAVYEGIIGPIAATAGGHTNTGNATAYWEANPVSDTDPANYFGSALTIDLIKYVSVNNQTSWDDANSPPGPSILVGKDVYFKFRIENTGNVTLTGITLTDTVYNLTGITPALPASLASGAVYEGIIGPIAATAGGHTNTGNATGYWEANPVSDTDPANYFGSPPAPAIDIEKHTNGVDADTAPGPYISINSTVTWTYIVTNTGDVDLTGIVVTDDKLGPIGTIAFLAVNATQTLYAYGTAAAGQYANNSTVVGYYDAIQVTDSDPSHYYNRPTTVGWETYPVNKLRVLLPWIALLGAIIAGASLLVLRHRRAQS